MERLASDDLPEHLMSLLRMRERNIAHHDQKRVKFTIPVQYNGHDRCNLKRQNSCDDLEENKRVRMNE